MNKELARVTILGMTRKVADNISDMIRSVDTVEAQIEEVKNIVEGMSLLEMLLGVEEIAKIAAKNTKVKQTPEERKALSSLMDCHLRLTEIYLTEKIPTIREISLLLAEVQLAIDKYEKVFADKKGAKMPDKEFYHNMFLLLNARIIGQQ